MRPVLPMVLAASLAVAGCSQIYQSRFNPLNWFGGSETVANEDGTVVLRPLVPENAGDRVIDARTLIGSVVDLSVDRTPDGAIVRATGTTTAPSQFNAELVPTSIENGVLNLAFRVQTPAIATTAQREPRQITVAYLVDNQLLSQIRSIQVQGSQNSRISRR